METIDPRPARYISNWGGRTLNLDGMTKIGAEAAGALSTWDGKTLTLRGIEHYDAHTIELIASTHNSSILRLSAVTELSDELCFAIGVWDRGSV